MPSLHPFTFLMFLSLVINNNLSPAWSSGISGDGKQVYYKSWPYGRSTGCIATTKLVWTAAAAVTLNGSEASAPLANGRGLKCIARRCIKSFGGQRGSLKSPLPTVLPMMGSCFPRPKHDQPFCSQILSVSRGCEIRSGSGLRMKLYDDPNPS